ncbi:MAG: hypothetical protein IJX38_06525 [Clostridia bacterium]|nr:hypothetical protein [Clostridia bacterium]
MNLMEKYILEYSDGFNFVFSAHLSKRIFDVEIEVDIFEYSAQYSHREKAHVILKKGKLIYECDFCDSHDYANDFSPIIFDDQRFICFRKTLYGFTLINADTLCVEFEYFPENVFKGEESFIIVDVKQLDDFLILEGCYWACPYECFAFDYAKKLFLNVSKICDLFSLDKTIVKDDELTLYGTDENDSEKQITVFKQDIIVGISKYGKIDF